MAPRHSPGMVLVLAAALHAAAARPRSRSPALNPMPTANPTADADAVVLCSATLRVTVLTPKIVRVERVPSPGDAFEDRATLGFVNRRLPVPPFTTANTSRWCNVTVTGGVAVALRKDAAPTPPKRRNKPKRREK